MGTRPAHGKEHKTSLVLELFTAAAAAAATAAAVGATFNFQIILQFIYLFVADIIAIRNKPTVTIVVDFRVVGIAASASVGFVGVFGTALEFACL